MPIIYFGCSCMINMFKAIFQRKEQMSGRFSSIHATSNHWVADRTKSMLLTFFGLIDDLRWDTNSPPPLHSRSTDAVVAGMQWIERANVDNSGNVFCIAFKNTRGLSQISAGSIGMDKYLSTSSSASPYSSLSSPASYSCPNLRFVLTGGSMPSSCVVGRPWFRSTRTLNNFFWLAISDICRRT